jgi:hypothetical protein
MGRPKGSKMMTVGGVRKLCWPDGTPVRGTVKAGKPKAPPGKVGIDDLNEKRAALGADPIDPGKVKAKAAAKAPAATPAVRPPPHLSPPTPPPRGAAPAPIKVILVCEDGADPTFAIFTSADLLKEIREDLAAIRKALEAHPGVTPG